MLRRSAYTPRPLCNRRTILRWLAGCVAIAGNANRCGAGEWPTRWRVGSIQFHADFPLPAESPVVADVIALRQSVSETLSIDSNNEPINIYVFSSRKIYDGYVQHYFPGVPPRRALFIKQQSSGMVFAFYSQELAIDLRHETTHAVLHTILPMVPLWLDEGLAEYFEVHPDHRVYDNPHAKSINRYVRWRRPTPLSKLESIRRLDQMKRDEYRDAWSWVHFLLHGPKAIRHEFLRYLADIRRHTPPGQLSRRLEAHTSNLSRAYADHFLRFRKPTT